MTTAAEAAIAAAQDIRDNMLTDLAQGSGLTAKLTAIETALTDFCTAVVAHNARVAHWQQQMRTAVAWQPDSDDYGGQRWELTPDGIALSATAADEASITRYYLPLRVGDPIGAVLYRVTHGYPEDFTRYSPGQSLAHYGDLATSNGPVDLTAMLGRAA